MLGTVLDRITKLVGRAFVISAFFPVLLFSAASLAALVFAEGTTQIHQRWEDLKGLHTLISVGFFLVTIALAYLLMTVSPVLKRLLEGAYPLWFIGKKLLTKKQDRFAKHREELKEKMDTLKEIRTERDKWSKTLQRAYLEAFESQKEEGATEPNKEGEDFQIAQKAIDEVSEFWKKKNKEIDPPNFIDAARKLKTLFKNNYQADMVAELERKLLKLWEDYEKVAEADFSETLVDIQSRYAFSSGVAGVKPTTLGNIMAATWSYPFTRYKIDGTLMWTRLQKVITADYLKVVEDARISYDFCVSMTFIAILYAIVYPFLIGNKLWPWGWIFPVASISLAVLFRAAAVEAARSFGEIFRTCFDLFRFTLLKELRIKIPTNLQAERETWDRINKILLFEEGDMINLDYSQLS